MRRTFSQKKFLVQHDYCIAHFVRELISALPLLTNMKPLYIFHCRSLEGLQFGMVLSVVRTALEYEILMLLSRDYSNYIRSFEIYKW